MKKEEVTDLVNSILQNGQYNVAKTPYHEHTGVDSPQIQYQNLLNAPGYFCVATTTTGTSPTYVFGGGGAMFNAIITGIFLGANDSTAGNITVSNNSNTVAVIAKGTTPGALTSATSITNVNYGKGTALSVVSSSAGNATVFIIFTS